jgi:hypothetical protein
LIFKTVAVPFCFADTFLVTEEVLDRGTTAFIQKAFFLDQLGLAVQEVLPPPNANGS